MKSFRVLVVVLNVVRRPLQAWTMPRTENRPIHAPDGFRGRDTFDELIQGFLGCCNFLHDVGPFLLSRIEVPNVYCTSTASQLRSRNPASRFLRRGSIQDSEAVAEIHGNAPYLFLSKCKSPCDPHIYAMNPRNLFECNGIP